MTERRMQLIKIFLLTITIFVLIGILNYTSNPEWETVWELLKSGKTEGAWTTYPPLDATVDGEGNRIERTFPSYNLVRNVGKGIATFLAIANVATICRLVLKKNH